MLFLPEGDSPHLPATGKPVDCLIFRKRSCCGAHSKLASSKNDESKALSAPRFSNRLRIFMNALSLATSAAGIFIISTSQNSAHEIRAPFGALHMEMGVTEAETALKAKSYTAEHGAILLHSEFNYMSYYISFNCLDRLNRCNMRDMRPMTIQANYKRDISFDIRPRAVGEILKNFGFDSGKARHDTDCAFWTTETAIVNVGRVCSSWGVRMRNNKVSWGYDPLRDTPCRTGCY